MFSYQQDSASYMQKSDVHGIELQPGLKLIKDGDL